MAAEDPGSDVASTALLEWIKRAQDATPADGDGDAGGVAAGFSLLGGWFTPGAAATATALPVLATEPQRLDRAVSWLRARHQPDGSFPDINGDPDSEMLVLTRVLAGLTEAQRVYAGLDDILAALATRLVARQGAEGEWGSAQDIYTGWALMEADRAVPNLGFGDAGLRGGVRILGQMRRNGWIVNCSYEGETAPTSPSLGNVLSGMIGVYRRTGDIRFLDTALLTGWALVAARRADGTLPGKLDSHWGAAVPWTSLLGNAQISICWLRLFQETAEPEFFEAARAINLYLRRSLALAGDPEQVGAVRTSFPINRGDRPYTFSTLASLLMIKAIRLEADVEAGRN